MEVSNGSAGSNRLQNHSFDKESSQADVIRDFLMPVSYRNAPVIERLASVRCRIEPEIFEARLAGWEELVKAEFPVYEPLKEWLLNVEEKEDIPLWNTLKPELRITPRFSKKHSSHGFDWSLRCTSKQFTMNMHSGGNVRRSYAQLREQISTWLPRWIDHFDAAEFESVHLQYLNLLNPETLSAFVRHPEGGDLALDIDKVLNVFVNIPTKDTDLMVPPFDCTATIKITGAESGIYQLQARAVPSAKIQPAVMFDLKMQTDVQKHLSSTAIIEKLDWCHDRLRERFELVFSDAAKQHFEPISE